MKPRIYTYKITFEEIPDWYWGVHKEKVYGENYWGSPVTNKWKWEFYTPKKQILELFPYSEEGWKEANLVEDRLIGPDLDNSLCLNESRGPKISIRVRKQAGKRGGATTRDRGVGVCGRSSEKMTEDGRKGGSISGPRSFAEGTGIFAMELEERLEANRRGGMTTLDKNRKDKTGLHGLDSDQLAECGHKGGLNRHKEKDSEGKSIRAKEMNLRSNSVKDENGKSVNAVNRGKATSKLRYIDPDHPELGAHRACNLALMQKKRGYPHGPENRVKVEKRN